MNAILPLYLKWNSFDTKQSWLSDLAFTLIRFLCGILIALEFGAPKFGMPWSPTDRNLDLFEVAYWFPQDVAEFGGIFALFLIFFAWMGAFSEAVGGLLLAIGFQTRTAAFLMTCTMLVAIFGQKWGHGIWSMLPAMGFLWVSVFHLILGGGRFSIDAIMYKTIKK